MQRPDVMDIAAAAGDALAELRELQVSERLKSAGTVVALGMPIVLDIPFGVQEATPGMPFDPTNPTMGQCSRQCDRAEDCIVKD